jgi:hypothetical protein
MNLIYLVYCFVGPSMTPQYLLSSTFASKDLSLCKRAGAELSARYELPQYVTTICVEEKMAIKLMEQK